jgi:hypothetical protein
MNLKVFNKKLWNQLMGILPFNSIIMYLEHNK